MASPIMTKNYPLEWPSDWPRCASWQRKPSGLFKVSLSQATFELEDELAKLGATQIVLTTNQRRGENPADPGAAVYFTLNGRDQCIPCDSYDTLLGNIRAIGLTVAALRGLERWGTHNMVDAAFAGFKALPPASSLSASPAWWTVLGLSPTASRADIETAYRMLVKKHHPDAGCDPDLFKRLNHAYHEAKEARG